MSVLGLELLINSNPQQREQILACAKNPQCRVELVRQVLDRVKRENQVNTPLQHSITALSGPGWIVLCLAAIDVPCPTSAADLVRNMIVSFIDNNPDVFLNKIIRGMDDKYKKILKSMLDVNVDNVVCIDKGEYDKMKMCQAQNMISPEKIVEVLKSLPPEQIKQILSAVSNGEGTA